MKIKNRWVSALIVAGSLLICGDIAAQENMQQSEIQAKKVLKEMADKTKAYSTIDMEFSAQYENKRTGDKSTSNGTLKVKGEKYVLDLKDMVTYSDETSVSVWQKTINELTISDHDEEAEGDMTPSKLFGAYEVGYKLHLLGDKTVNGEECVEVDLYPTAQKSAIVRIRLSISKKTKQLKRFYQQYKLGETLTVDVKKFVPNKPMADKEFAFDRELHKEVEIIDLR
ncbi:MAG: outer membrane lipoprotein carrier protein LolA [Bacteroidales bacterium]|nr:outer membrane lipoprotein carrier protein LolA [Bacteroidales bacterium]